MAQIRYTCRCGQDVICLNHEEGIWVHVVGDVHTVAKDGHDAEPWDEKRWTSEHMCGVPPHVLAEIAQYLITTAVEGGINYWATVSNYRWGNPDIGRSDDHPWRASDTAYASVTVHNSQNGATYEVDEAKVLAALDKLLTGEVEEFHTQSYSKSYRQRLISLLDQAREGVAFLEADHDFDSDDADCIMQIACLGKVTY